MVAKQYGQRGLAHAVASSNGRHASLDDVMPRVAKSRPPLVDTVVVGHVQVGEAMLAEAVEPFGLCAEDEALHDGCLNLRGRAFQIAHDNLRLTEHGVDTRRKQGVNSVMVNNLPYSAV